MSVSVSLFPQFSRSEADGRQAQPGFDHRQKTFSSQASEDRLTAMVAACKVCVVVDRNFGERLAGLPRGVPVWIVDTPSNKPVAQRLWKERPDENHLTGITTFDDMEASSPEELLIAKLDSIDLHHGAHSADPPYAVLEVLGTRLTDRAKHALAAYGFDEFHEDPSGFRAMRLELVN
ncbi:MAG TPA: hypothetical protein VMH00_12500 [Candidatus Limnocylindrales bacterium]|nr:hypothetical protein [Candidatus Limnocylindrales bacterium]